VAGRSAAAPIRRFRADDLTPNVAAEMTEPMPDDADRAGVFAIEAARQALADADLARAPAHASVVLGTTLGGMEIFEAWDGGAGDDLGRVPYFAPAARVARVFGCGGPVVTPQLACASGTHALAMAADLIRGGAADVVLAGGTDLLCRFVVSGFNALRATAPSAHPFDRDRAGLILGEGAAVLVIENAAHAAARGARIRARLVGVGAAADATHMTAPDREGGGAARAIAAALADAGIAMKCFCFLYFPMARTISVKF
jgi:3-oxoacyl-(acyl-carrier-protein) synthase